MKNIEHEVEDDLRPEYKRSDFGELVRGKYGVTQVEFAELCGLLLACIAEDEGLIFSHHSIGNYLADHRHGEWTFEIDNSNQITLRFWLTEFSSICEELSNPPSIVSPEHQALLQTALVNGVKRLKEKAAAEHGNS